MPVERRQVPEGGREGWFPEVIAVGRKIFGVSGKESREALDVRSFELGLLQNSSSLDLSDHRDNLRRFEATSRVLSQFGGRINQAESDFKKAAEHIRGKGFTVLPNTDVETRIGRQIMDSLSEQDKILLGFSPRDRIDSIRNRQGERAVGDEYRQAYARVRDLLRRPQDTSFDAMVPEETRKVFNGLGGKVDNVNEIIGRLDALGNRKVLMDDSKRAREQFGKKAEVARSDAELQMEQNQREEERRHQNQAFQQRINQAMRDLDKRVSDERRVSLTEGDKDVQLVVGDRAKGMTFTERHRAYQNMSPEERNAYDFLERLKHRSIDEARLDARTLVNDSYGNLEDEDTVRKVGQSFVDLLARTEKALGDISFVQGTIRAGDKALGQKYQGLGGYLEEEIRRNMLEKTNSADEARQIAKELGVRITEP